MKSLLPFICFLIARIQPSFVENEIKKTDNETRELTNAVDQKNVTDNLVLMVSHLTNLVIEQEKTMANFYTKVMNKLEKQEEILSLLFKKRSKSTQSNSSTKSVSSPPTATQPPPSPEPQLTTSGSAWSYSNLSWSGDHPSCGIESQSPVNLHTVDVVLRDHKQPISFSSYDQINEDTCKLVNTGNTATLLLTNTTSPQPTMTQGPLNSTEYHFIQAVFHWGSNDSVGSEHTVRDTAYSMEMQLIHQSSSQEETKLAVASFLFEISQNDNPFIAPIIESLASIKGEGSKVELNALKHVNTSALAIRDEINDDTPEAMDTFSMDLLIQDSTSGPYFTYSGSLTYPPCTEVKQYIVFRTPLDISSVQLDQFRSLLNQDGKKMVNNFRPVQPLGNRVLAFTM